MEFNDIKYYNLTHPQKRIWYIDKINFNSPLHNLGGCLNIKGNIDVDKLKETLNLIIKINDGLRLRLTEKEGQPFQYIKDYKKENIEYIDFSKYESPREEQLKWAKSLFRKTFQLYKDKLYYFAIYKINERQYGVLLNIHHIISDGWSISLIQQQICEIYNNISKDNQIHIDKYHSYVDFIKDEENYINSERFIRNQIFWNEKFDDIPEEFLYKTSSSIKGRRQVFNISTNLSNNINKFIEERKCSLNTFFITILLIYINKTANKKDIVIGIPVFNRKGKKQKKIVGMFTSTVPFRFYLDTESNIDDLINSINKELKFSLLNQKYPYDLLIKDLDLSRRGYDSLFKMSVNYYNSEYINDIEGIDVDIEEYYCGSQSYSLQLTVKEIKEDNISVNIDYKTDEYSEQEIKVLSSSIINIIKQITIEDKQSVEDLSLLNQDEINYKLYTINSTNNSYPSKTVYELFQEQAIKTPDKIALEFKEEKLTYKELNEKSNQLANYLIENGVKKENTVGIMSSHSIQLIINILAVLKSGASYLPIDPNYPIERINYMLEDSNSMLLLTNFEVKNDIRFNGKIINTNNINLELYSKENYSQINRLEDLAYIIYTSGSTGKPKGVMIEHKGLTNYIYWANKMYLNVDEEAMALYSSISFDLTVTSIFAPLISGNRILIYDRDDTDFILYKVLKENKATVIKLTPAHLTLLKGMDNSKSNIKRFIVGGEELKVSLAQEIYNNFNKNIEIYNEYGPTETAVGCIIHKYEEEKDKKLSVPIGYSIDNVQVYILDKNFNIVPTGTIGELYVSGAGVARGYLNKRELTCEKFINNLFIKGEKMYKTGDTARYLETGEIEYVGRVDNQVKIRGHRIELGEIERCLLENKAVKEVVVTFKEDLSGNNLLNSYIVRKSELTVLELKRWFLRFLPQYMIPNNFVFIDKLPLTDNGKIDYSLLPKPQPIEKEFIKYNNNLERELVKAMEEILGVENISMNDNYYQLGGDSIKAIQIASKLKNIGLEVKVKDMLTYDSIEEIANTLEENKNTISIRQDLIEGYIHNTPIIKWFFNKNFTNENLYNHYVLLEYNQILDINKIEIAMNKLIEHHDTLRFNYDRENNKLYYNNNHLNKKKNVKHFNLSEGYDYNQNKNIKFLINKADVKFNLENSRLFDITIFDLDKDRQALLFTAHHLIVDGVSWRINGE
ncbi:amino acid adenylation domain-containing protein [Anaeromonas gelatinilytica]|uniref:amino acid adenylation domain-containing protein n=1 Tax=Anaeromonas gelatinilytica TaxID=2683194 RepID=UPI00207855AF|nr:amino acid adenylation domain-containing protein [Anaeromonas gelatinilytica]